MFVSVPHLESWITHEQRAASKNVFNVLVVLVSNILNLCLFKQVVLCAFVWISFMSGIWIRCECCLVCCVAQINKWTLTIGVCVCMHVCKCVCVFSTLQDSNSSSVKPRRRQTVDYYVMIYLLVHGRLFSDQQTCTFKKKEMLCFAASSIR
jgi:hypothetical protein